MPLASYLDGIVYELEPWEQARRERLASYARERDKVLNTDLDRTPLIRQ